MEEVNIEPGTFAETWQSFAFQTPEYSRRDKYTTILSLLGEIDNQYGTVLTLRGNHPLLMKDHLCDEDIEVLTKSLNSQQRVRTISLDLSYNSMTNEGVAFLAEFLKSPNCPLQVLNLSYNDIECTGAESLSNALQFNTSLTALTLDGCKIGHKGGICIASMLQVNKSLQVLSLSATDLHTDCLIALSTVLHGNKTVTSLDLSRPLLHSKLEETTIHISKMLQVNSMLRELTLSMHSMTDTGVEWLCRMLRENAALQYLNISCNKLSRDGARHLSVLLQHNTPLTALDIGYNRIEDEGLLHISNILATTNHSLTRLNVCSNSVGDEGLCALASALHTNTTLAQVTVWGNQLGEPACNAFRELFENGRLLPESADVMYYEVDGTTYLARTDTK